MKNFLAALLIALAPLWSTSSQALEYSKPFPKMVSYVAPQTHPDSMPAEAWRVGDEVKVAQVGFGGMLPGPGTVHTTGGGGGFSGIGDAKTARGHWGIIPYSAAFAASNGAMFNLCDSGLLNCHDIHATTAGGRNATDMAFNSCDTSGLCQAKIVYDQTGNGQNITICASALGCPLFTPNAVSAGHPALTVNVGASAYSGSITGISPPFAMAMGVASTNVSTGSNVRVLVAPDPIGMLCCNSGHWGFLLSSLFYASTSTAVNNTFYSVQGGSDGTGTGTSSYIRQNGTEDLGNAGSATFTGTPGRFFGEQSWTEGAIFNSLPSSGEKTAIDSAIRTNGGF